MFQKYFEMTSDAELSFTEFSNKHLDILNCISVMEKTWWGVTCMSLNSAWKKLRLGYADERDFEGLESIPIDPIYVLQSIVYFGEIIGLKTRYEYCR